MENTLLAVNSFGEGTTKAFDYYKEELHRENGQYFIIRDGTQLTMHNEEVRTNITETEAKKWHEWNIGDYEDFERIFG